MRIPLSTYRLQFNKDFDFQKAREILGYLAELGISDIYASPVFKAREGSDHGYDVVDMNQLNPSLGSEAEFDLLIKDLKSLNMGWIQDIVPNHMAFDGENQMLMDVLENGRHSEYFEFFDIDWNHVYETLSDRLLAPFLGKHYSESLDSGEIQLGFDMSGFYIKYYSLKLPLKIESYVRILTHRLHVLRERLGSDHPDLIKFLGILYSLKNLPETPEERLGRYSQIQFIKRLLWELYTQNQAITEFINENIMLFNGGDDPERDFTLLDTLLSEQHYRLAFWKVANEELNYRRFFNINGLISLRIEDERVFNTTHSLIFNLIKNRKIDGLRIDHIDGLYDPTGYLKKLRERAGDIFIIVEKILGIEEDLPQVWSVQGTTGYDFLNYVNGIFVSEENGSRFNRLYYHFTGFRSSYDAVFYEKKKLVIEKDMTGDVDNLVHLLKRISSKNRYGNDMTLYGLKKALIEILAYFPVYRTYISNDHYSESDRRYMLEAIRKARETNPGLLYELDFIERFLTLEFDNIPEDEKRQWIHFVMRFQQITGPLMAKGFEDTTLYVYNRLLSLNEVGGSPDRFGFSPTEFHEFNIKRSRRQPHTMNTTSTHDTKRGEDVRARINVLSEIPERWDETIRRWSRINRKFKKTIRGISVPDKNDEYFLYQTLVGAYPFYEDEVESFRGRLKQYIIKAVREAKVHTAWLKPDEDYEENYLLFIDKILDPSTGRAFLEDFLGFQQEIAYYGVFNSLSQTLLKITAPGFPDFYQGTELWDLNLVDPDNRRPVDFKKRMAMLDEIKTKMKEDRLSLIDELLTDFKSGRIKLYLIVSALGARKRLRTLFEKGTYTPLQVEGPFSNNIIAFARQHNSTTAITIVPRFLTGLIKPFERPFGKDVWADTTIILPPDIEGEFVDVFTGKKIYLKEKVFVGDILTNFSCSFLCL